LADSLLPMSQSVLRALFYGSLGLGLSWLCASAEQAAPAQVEEASVALRRTAMPKMGIGRLGSILHRYYEEGLGGPDSWEKVVSLRVSGRLKLEGGEFKFNAYQKKPHYIKMTIYGDRRHMKMGYGGSTAWQVLAKGGDAVEMEADQARHFIHSARFGNYLLYPYALGKQLEYLDTVPVDGTICHQVRVTLDSGYQVDYFIDIRTYLEIKVITTDLRSERVTSVVYEDYIRELGMPPIAQKVVSSENGVWASTLELDEVKVNSGIMPWMFKMPK
jgi:hypothetical protein